MLLGQNGGGHQHRHLLAVHDGFERGAQSDFGFAVTDVAADQAVHRLGALHVLLDFLDGLQLILGFDVGKRGFQLVLPGGIRAEGVAAKVGPHGIQL